ncbi:6301_t:CDS:2, partial [Funneliformis geosporum]
DESVKDIEVPELEPCSECNNEILMLPIKAFTVLSCDHVFHRECIEKIFLLTQQNNCPINNYTAIINPEDDDSEEVESIPLRSTQPEQSTSVSSS